MALKTVKYQISTYINQHLFSSLLDMSIYFTGTAFHSPSCDLTMIHSGVQFTDLQGADLCTAILLLVACKFPTQKLANIHIDVVSSEDTFIYTYTLLSQEMSPWMLLRTYTVKKNRHCKTKSTYKYYVLLVKPSRIQ